jgi:hypothetical protein
MPRPTTVWCSLFVVALAGCAGHSRDMHDATDGGPLDAGRAFARMQTLAGSYEATVDSTSGTTKVSYEVTSAGHALLEKLSEGSDQTMVSMYFLEGSDLAMVHYCAMGNRPHLRLDREHSTIDDLRFEWDGTATDVDATKDAHIHSARFRFKDPQTVESAWTFWKDGQAQHTTTFTLDRKAALSK